MLKRLLYAKRIEYILEWNLENALVCIFSVPFSLKGSSKCSNHVNVHKLCANDTKCAARPMIKSSTITSTTRELSRDNDGSLV